MSTWNDYITNKKILDEVNEAIDISNDPESTAMDRAFAQGAILMEEIICNELRALKTITCQSCGKPFPINKIEKHVAEEHFV